ncbi:golgin subfamily A member 5 [Drosophila rhopaloa]|uniref:Golgin subfamily A member 5 n=1 Tax=Drosophila rhopaloa TaxID=1041015 RepID=A0A6P4DZL1_DRORH|nr:golgin subfamily A member 5 [Drosophila rhopaloa]
MAVSAEIERVMGQGNCLMPDINISQGDLANPCEGVVTKILVHYLKCFGFRLDPPYKTGSELAHSSREGRVFLIRLCRQVERIIQISFPNKTYTYVDIIKPAVKKTLSTLSYLFNYLAYYKVFKKKVLGPVEETIKLKDSLTAEIKAKSLQLEQRRQKADTVESDRKDCEVAINQLKKELQDTQAKLHQLKKSCSEHVNGLELLEQEEIELGKRICHWEQLVVEDSQVMELRNKIKVASSHVESCKAELASKEQVTNEHRRVIEASQQAATALEKATAALAPSKLEDYKESTKQLEAMGKQVPTLEASYQQRRQDSELKKKEISSCDQQYDTRKQKHDSEDRKLQKQLEQLQVDLRDRKSRMEDLETVVMELNQRNLGLEQLHGILSEHLCEALGENWQINST